MKEWKDYQKGAPGSGEDEVVPVKEEGDQVPGGQQNVLVPIEQFLPALSGVSTNPLVVRTQQQQHYGLILNNYCATVDRIKALKLEKEREAEKQTAVGGGTAQVSQSTNLPAVLPKEKHAIALARSADALDEVRKKLGLDEIRDELLKEIEATLDPARALKMLDRYAQAFGKRCRTIEEANEIFPHLTLTELSFMSLLEEYPRTFLEFGTKLDISSLMTKDTKERIDTSGDHKRVPQQFIASVDGISYINDAFNISEYDRDDNNEYDSYSALGMSTHREGMETIGFRADIGKKVRALIPLLMSNMRMYERVWAESDEGIQVGFGRIARLALERRFGEEKKIGEDNNIQAVIATLDPGKKQVFQQERALLERKVAAATLYDGTQNLSKMPEEDVFKLVGILDHVPACLIGEQPFVGFIQPYGVCVRFYTEDGEPVEECALSPVHRREAVLSLHAEMSEGSKENRTVAKLFKELTIRAQSKILKTYEESPQGQLSILETAAIDLWLKHGVYLEVLGIPVIHRAVSGTQRDLRFRHEKLLTGKPFSVDFTSKIGTDEAQQYLRTLELLPKQLLKHVEVVRKKQNPDIDVDSIMTGMTTEGYYTEKDKTVTIQESPSWLYPDMSGKAKAARSHTLVHEVGEAAWTDLSKEEQEQWARVSWPVSKRQRLKKHFLTHYSHHVGDRDDFCEHFALYALHGPEFRLAAAEAGPLKKKYGFLREAIRARVGEVIENPKILPWTIEEIHGAVEKEIREKKELEEAWFAEERAAEDRAEERREHIYEIRQSFERLAEEEEKEADLEEIEDSVDRRVAEFDSDVENVYPRAVEVEGGWLNYDDISVHLLEALRSQLDTEDDESLKPLRDGLFPLLLDNDWEEVMDLLKGHCDSRKALRDLLHALREVDLKPKNITEI